MNLVDEQDGVVLLLEAVEDLLDALFEIAAIPCAGNQRTEIQCVDLGGLQHVGHVPLLDAQRQPFGERRLADAGLTHEQRIVLATPA
jgi:hypothetical protein